MKKTVIYGLLVIFLNTSAQNAPSLSSKSKSYLGISSGYSLLMGSLTQSAYADPKSGYAAKNGFNIGVEGAYYFHKNLGICGIYSNSSFYTNGIQSLADGYKEDFDVDSTTVSVTGKYTLNNLLAGPCFSFPFGRFSLDLRLVAGISVLKSPQFVTYLEDQSNATFSQNSARAFSFAYQAGIGIRYSLTRQLALGLRADYFGSRPDLKPENVNRPNRAGRLISDYHQPVMILHCGLGLFYQFGKS